MSSFFVAFTYKYPPTLTLYVRANRDRCAGLTSVCAVSVLDATLGNTAQPSAADLRACKGVLPFDTDLLHILLCAAPAFYIAQRRVQGQPSTGTETV